MQSQDLTDSQWERLRELVPGGRKGKRGTRSDGGSSSTRCFGWPVPALAGAICQSGTATSTRSRHGTIDGCEQAILTGSSMPSSRTLTLSGWPSMPPSFGPTLRLPGPGAQKGGEAQALGRSRRGFGTKLYAVTDALGLPVRLTLGPGQQNEMAAAYDLI